MKMGDINEANQCQIDINQALACYLTTAPWKKNKNDRTD